MTIHDTAALLPLNTLTGIVAVVAVFGGLIFFHELGHFLVARLFGMGVKTFSLGFGPALISKTVGKTRYQVAAFPLGGFVSLVGEQAGQDIPAPFTEKDSFALRPAWQRFFVIAAGSVFNLLLAWILCWVILVAYGNPVLRPEIGAVSENSPAYTAGIQPGETVIAVNGAPVSEWTQMFTAIQESQGKPLSLELEKDGLVRVVSATPKRTTVTDITGDEREIWAVGISPSQKTEYVPMAAGDAAKEAVFKAKGMAMLVWKAFTGLVTRKVSFDNVGGPILIGKTIFEEATTGGLMDVLFLAAFISVNLGVMNLLPIPVLDGGHMLFIIIEMIIRRPVPRKVQETSMAIGLALLLLLMFFATANDISRLFLSGPS